MPWPASSVRVRACTPSGRSALPGKHADLDRIGQPLEEGVAPLLQNRVSGCSRGRRDEDLTRARGGGYSRGEMNAPARILTAGLHRVIRVDTDAYGRREAVLDP